MIYIHIPYCKGKCIYCNFYSGGNPHWEKFFNTLASELSERIDELRGASISSIYFGGGTPSLAPPEYVEDYLQTIFIQGAKHSIKFEDDLEITLEVNPEDVTEENSVVWKKAGINRISMGVQSLQNSELKLLNRRHSAERVYDAIRILKRYFKNLSLDLIYGIPGQTVTTLNESLNKILYFSPNHISTYSLTFEQGTPLYLLKSKGMVEELDEEAFLEFDNLIDKTLKREGYERYEISNYAKPGYRSKHNSGYWDSKAYLGLGPSACSYDGKRIRRTNLPDLNSYLEGTVLHDDESLSDEELKEEYIMTRLRTHEGISLEDFKLKFGEDSATRLIGKAYKWAYDGRMIQTGSSLSLTLSGIPVSDYIILDLLQ